MKIELSILHGHKKGALEIKGLGAIAAGSIMSACASL